MAESIVRNRPLSVEEYFEMENAAPIRHEYVGGMIYAMTGVSRRHSRISLNIARKLADAAEGGPCRVHAGRVKAQIPGSVYYYPDVMVACGREPENPYIEDQPCLVVEVISPSTEQTDRREKLSAYRTIPSLDEYLIVEQDEKKVTRHFRDDDGVWWRAEFVGEGSVPVSRLRVTLSLSNIYRGVEITL